MRVQAVLHRSNQSARPDSLVAIRSPLVRLPLDQACMGYRARTESQLQVEKKRKRLEFGTPHVVRSRLSNSAADIVWINSFLPPQLY